jgi:nucleotide-binding universal stress UspA family protein
MPIRKILVPLFESPDDRHAILYAVEIARSLGAHVTVMFSGGQLSELVSADAPRYGRVKNSLQIEARTLLAEQTEAARKGFESLVSECGLQVAEEPDGQSAGTISFEARRGHTEATTQEAAAFHDLVLFYRDRDTTGSESLGFTTIKSALQDCGRPILVVPATAPRPFASNIAIAFNGSIEGAHAVSAALSMLSAAKSVHILTVATQSTSADEAQQLQNYLRWHGVRAEIHTSKAGSDSVGATLLKMVEEVRADLFVLGGYTHNRIRQTILGGVTHHVLRHAAVPVLFSK